MTQQRVGTAFRKRTAVVLMGVAALSLVASLIFAALAGKPPVQESADSDTFSRSALGHHALRRYLENLGLTVIASRHGSARKVRPSSPLLVLEPHLTEPRAPSKSGTPLVHGLADLLAETKQRQGRAVVVLSKWGGFIDGNNPGWVGHVMPLGRSLILPSLRLTLGSHAERRHIIRAMPASGWRSRLPGGWTPSLAYPQVVDRKLVTHAGFQPLIENDQGVLLARSSDRSTYLLTDPDVLNTAGLGKGNNAQLVRALVVDELGASSVIIDETLHGYFVPPSLWYDLISYPLVLVTLHFVLLLLLVLWATVGRFGKPLALAPRLAAGKRTIIDTTADLLTRKHAYDSLVRYLSLSVRRAALHCALAPASEAEHIEQLDAIARARGSSDSLSQIREEVAKIMQHRPGAAGRASIAVAMRLHRYCKEITQ